MHTCFIVVFAGVRVKVNTCFEELKILWKDYLVDDNSKDFDFEIQTNEELKSKYQVLFKEMYGPDSNLTDVHLESITLHALISQRLADYDCLLMHGSALAYNGTGTIFIAPSGTGKSTHSRLWRELLGDQVTMINDDKPFILCKTDEISICGSPWNGKHKIDNNIAVPLKNIVILKRGKENSINKINATNNFHNLLNQIFFDRENREFTIKVMNLISRMADKVDFYELYCNTDIEAAKTSFAELY